MRNKGNLLKILSVVFAAFLTFLPSENVFAKLTEAQMDMFAQNNILFYDPDGGMDVCGGSLVGSYDGRGSAGLSELQATFVDTYHDIAESLSIQYGIPWETVMAQGILESTAGTSPFATQRNNFFGIAAYDSNPDAARSYNSPEEGWRGYFENIKNTSTYRKHGVFSDEAITNPYVYAQRIKDAGYATDELYVQKLTPLIQAIENRASEKGWKSSAELASEHPEMYTNAAMYAAADKSDPAYNATSMCVYAAGNGSINETAIGLAWPDRSHAATDPSPAYKTALEQTGVNRLGDQCSMGGYSCDAFLATVMRYSGADTEFPCCGAGNQLNYLEKHTELYQEIPNLGNTSNLQPGDIRASNKHVEIVVRLSDGSFKIASASHCNRTADYGHDYYEDSSFKVFRRK